MSYTVTPLRLDEHRAQLARLWAENMSDGRISSALPARMGWLYERGPDGPPTTLLCLASESGDVVGCGSFIRRPIWVGGAAMRAGLLCDFAVARAHRVGGAALAIQRALMEAALAAGLELLYGYPNAKSVAIFKRIGYRVVGETSTWLKPLRAAYKLREALPWKHAASVAALPIDVGLSLMDHGRRLRARGPSRGALLAGPDERFDALWKLVRTADDIVGEKSSAYLDWRYRQFPTAEHRFFALLSPDGEQLAGYAVFTVREGKAFVRDLLAGPLPGVAEALLLALGAHLRDQRLDTMSLSYLGPKAFGDRLRSLGFLRRPETRALVVHPAGLSETFRTRLFEPENWFMLDGELDI